MYVNLMQFPQSHAGWPTPAGGHLRKFAFGTFSRLSDHSSRLLGYYTKWKVGDIHLNFPFLWLVQKFSTFISPVSISQKNIGKLCSKENYSQWIWTRGSFPHKNVRRIFLSRIFLLSDLSYRICVCLFYCLRHIFLKLELYGCQICIHIVFAFAYFIVWGIFSSESGVVVKYFFITYLIEYFSEYYFIFSDTRAELSLNTEIYVKPGSALSLECRYTTHCRHIRITKSGVGWKRYTIG